MKTKKATSREYWCIDCQMPFFTPRIKEHEGHAFDICEAQPQHTPTPWKVSANGCVSSNDLQTCIAIAPTYGVEEFKTDSAFIVRACNAFEPMLEALKLAQRSLTGPTQESQHKVNQIISEAIAKAEGK